MSAMRFDDDVVIVTGAGRGLGREYALAFAKRGAAVAQGVVDEIVAAGGRAAADSHSVVTGEGAQAIVQTALDTFGKLTVLVNNAGTIAFAPLPGIGDEDWRRMLSVTLDGTFNMCRAAWPVMAAQGYGRIVNTTSNAGFAGNETLSHYGAAKLGVAGLTKCLAQEVKDSGIQVNAVAPMAVTRMNREVFFGGAVVEGDNWREDIAAGKVPMGPAEIVAPTVLWLAHRSTTLNGEIFSSSSGKVARVGFVVGEGYFDPHHGPEELRDNAEAIRRLGDYLDPTFTGDELAAIPPLFGA